MENKTLNIENLRNIEPKILAVVGTYTGIIQPMLDFDYLSGRSEPTIKAIIGTGRNYLRLFWGEKEILVPVYGQIEDLPSSLAAEINLYVSSASPRRTLSTVKSILDTCPNILGGSIFAEDVPESHAIEIYNYSKAKNAFAVGPASVGILIPQKLKLGAIAGVQAKQLIDIQAFKKGNIAAFSASGGMTNELINLLIKSGRNVSFALSFGGDRFPGVAPKEAFLAAEADPETEGILYFGELGGYDEYDIVEMVKQGKIKKPIVAYIAGTISEMFPEPPQFGHAKAMASRGEETAQAKRDALIAAGKESGVDIKAASSYEEFVEFIATLPSSKSLQEGDDVKLNSELQKLARRKEAYFMSTLSGERDGEVEVLGEDLLEFAKKNSYAEIFAKLLLGKKEVSAELVSFTDIVTKMLVDHGPYQSGAINTMITARAGKDLMSALATGILTIGPRFGGAINDAAGTWLSGVARGVRPFDLVEEFAAQKKYIPGIGHKKYHADKPDPRVQLMQNMDLGLSVNKYSNFAKEVAGITTAKKGNLILNVDGTVAAILLDILSEKEGMSEQELERLVEIEFFNAFFVIPRTLGFAAHYFDQRRLDEGLFRFTTKEVVNV